MFRTSNLSDLRREARGYLRLTKVLGLMCFTSATALGRNQGWELQFGTSLWETDKVIIPLWLGIALGVIFFLSLLLDIPMRQGGRQKWWTTNVCVASMNVLFGAACIVTVVCVSSIFTASLPVVYLAQLASARMDPRLLLGSSVPFCIAFVVEGILSRKVVNIYAQITYIISIFGVLGLVVYHRIQSETTRRGLWSSRQSVITWRASMSRILCDMLPKQYAQDLVMSVGKNKELGSAASTQTAVVLFSDLVGFTALNEKVSSDTLIKIMHHLWRSAPPACCLIARYL